MKNKKITNLFTQAKDTFSKAIVKHATYFSYYHQTKNTEAVKRIDVS